MKRKREGRVVCHSKRSEGHLVCHSERSEESSMRELSDSANRLRRCARSDGSQRDCAAEAAEGETILGERGPSIARLSATGSSLLHQDPETTQSVGPNEVGDGALQAQRVRRGRLGRKRGQLLANAELKKILGL